MPPSISAVLYWIGDRFASLWKLLVGLSVIAGLVGTYVLLPQIEFSPGESLAKTDPLETRFNITNKTFYDLVETSYSCAFRPQHPYQSTTIFHVGPSGFDKVKPGMPQSVYCGPLPWWFKNTPSGMLNVSLRYKLNFFSDHTFETGALFLLKRDAAGEVHWFPYGKGVDSVTALKTLEEKFP